MSFSALDIINQMSEPDKMALKLNSIPNADGVARIEAVEALAGGKANIVVVSGVADTETITLAETPEAIIAVLAVVSATGAVASKFLLAPTTDYTIATNVITCVTDQSANKLIVVYK